MNKTYLLLAVVMFVSMLTIPLSARNDNTPPTVAAAAMNTEKIVKSNTDDKIKSVKIYIKNDKKTIKSDAAEYVLGVVASEMDASYHDEALKAQAVAAYTLMLYRREENSDEDYDITDDSSTDQSYINKDARRKKWGDNFNKHEQRLSKLIDSVLYQKITYKDKPILAAYHAISGGKTESAKNVWGSDYAYLQPSESVSDMLSPSYISTVTYTADEFISLADTLGVKLSGKPEKMIGTPSCTASGTVSSCKIGGKRFSGAQIRSAFSLRSSNFDISAADNKVVFTVRGYGHGVGMSQYGAQCMAQQGSTYLQILKWYYKNCEICS